MALFCWVVADIVTSIRDKHNRALFLVIMGLLYIFSDYNIISVFFKMISFQEFLNVYNSNISMILMGVRNMLVSLNILVFIVYMIILMRNQMKENARIALLNIQLETAQCKTERNECPASGLCPDAGKNGRDQGTQPDCQEIHDTLGHTMTGLSAAEMTPVLP